MKRYYDPEKEFTVSQIITDFDIDARPGEFSSLQPATIHTNECPFCESVKLQSRAPTRSAYGQNIPTCPNCGHKEGHYCNCFNCRKVAQAEKEEIEQAKRGTIFHYYGNESWSSALPVNEFTLKDAIYLKAIVTHNASENMREVTPTVYTQTRFTPGNRMIWDVLRHLYHRSRAIVPNPESDLSSFIFEDGDDEAPSFNLNSVRWLLLPTLALSERLAYLRDIDGILRGFNEADGIQIAEREIWHQIVKYEAIEYYEHKLSEVNVELDNIGDRTHAVFDDLADRFSLAQIYHIIFVTVRNTHHYATQQRIPRHHAKNLYVGAIERNANKYEVEGWLKDYRRDFNCPQSTLSSVFFDFYLGVGASYFETKIPIPPKSESL